MGTLLLERPQASLFAAEDRSLTLADVVGGAWDGLAAGAPVVCPVCGDLMVPEHDEGRCRSCNSALA
jgi:hypothetical protein